MVLSIGDIMLDIYIEEPSKLHRDTDTAGRTHLKWGGSAANFAVWAARLGMEVAISGRVGRDFVGEAAAADFAKEGVRPLLAIDGLLPTGTVAIRSRGASGRDMVCDRKANMAYCPDDLPVESIKVARWVQISGYTVIEQAPRAAVRQAIELAAASGAAIGVDPGSCSLIGDLGIAKFMEAVEGATAIFPNLQEAALITGSKNPDEMAARLLEHFPMAVVKMGPEGALYASRKGAKGHARGIKAEAVDVNGAGDSFAAAFSAEYLSGADIARATEAGCALAALVVSKRGARPDLDISAWKALYGRRAGHEQA